MSQEALVGIWREPLPGALVPLWQEAQLPACTPACGLVAGIQAAVEWQVSQEAVVWMCIAGLVCALELTNAPLWQVWQLPAETPSAGLMA